MVWQTSLASSMRASSPLLLRRLSRPTALSGTSDIPDCFPSPSPLSRESPTEADLAVIGCAAIVTGPSGPIKADDRVCLSVAVRLFPIL